MWGRSRECMFRDAGPTHAVFMSYDPSFYNNITVSLAHKVKTPQDLHIEIAALCIGWMTSAQPACQCEHCRRHHPESCAYMSRTFPSSLRVVIRYLSGHYIGNQHGRTALVRSCNLSQCLDTHCAVPAFPSTMLCNAGLPRMEQDFYTVPLGKSSLSFWRTE